METTNAILYVFVGALIGWLSTKLMILWATTSGMLSVPNERSAHHVPKPAMGGIFILPILIIWSIYAATEASDIIFATVVAGITIVGFVDDLISIKAKSKLVFQILAGLILFASGFSIEPLFTQLGLPPINYTVELIATVLFVCTITNAMNLIDGVDGLFSGINLINVSILVIIFGLFGLTAYSPLMLLLLGGLLAFLRFNFQPSKIFIGDTGSLGLGLIVSAMILKVFSLSDPVSSSLALACCILPCMDMLRLIIVRVYKGKSPFKADKNHCHHLLLISEGSHSTVMLICCFTHAVIIACSSVAIMSNLIVALSLSLMTGILLYAFIEFRLRRHHKKQLSSLQNKLNQLYKSNRLLQNLVR